MVRVASSFSRRYVTRRALGAMVDTVTIHRPGDTVFDDQTGFNAATETTKIYQGKARIYSVAGPQVVEVGEADLTFRSTYISIPAEVFPAPHRDDIVIVLEARSDEELQGKAFRVLDVEGGGLVRAVRRMQCTSLEESSSWSP
jgi:Family of unknown function (DUF6093)